MNALMRCGRWVAVWTLLLLATGCMRVQRVYVTADGEVIGNQELRIETEALRADPHGALTARWHGTGDWTSPHVPGHLMLTTKRVEEGSSSTWVRTVSLQDVSGLPAEGDDRASGPISMRIARPAGSLRFGGEREGEKASGTVRLEPDATVGKELETAFGARPTPEQWIALVLDDVPATYAREVRAIDETATLDDALRLHRYGIRPAYLREARGAVPDVTLEQVVQLNRYGISAEYASKLRDAGYTFGADDIVRLNRYSVSTDYAKAAKASGYGASAEELVHLNRYSVSPSFMQGYASAGYKFSADDLIELNRYSISPHYAKAVREAGYDPSADDLVKLNRYGISPKYLAMLHTDGGPNLSVDEVIELNRKGIDGETIRKLRGSR